MAKQLRIRPGIVAGRYRHLTGNWSYFKELTRSFDWDDINYLFPEGVLLWHFQNKSGRKQRNCAG
jgi:hypothetical protein